MVAKLTIGSLGLVWSSDVFKGWHCRTGGLLFARIMVEEILKVLDTP